MMKSRHSALSGIENKIGAKSFLEFTIHLLEIGYFNPVVFCHDRLWFDKAHHAQVMIGFINLLSYLYSCGVTIETRVCEPTEIEAELYSNIMRDENLSGSIRCYELLEMDLFGLDLQRARVPENCEEEDFAFVKLYLMLRTGAALNRKALENLFGKKFTDMEMLTLRKQFTQITGKEMIKRKDNSYEMGCLDV